MNPTRVISVRGLRPDEFLADPEAVYVGRALPRLGWKGSAWGNPFRVGMTAGDVLRLFDVIPEADRRRDAIVVLDTPVNAVELFAEYVRVRRSLWDRLPELKGKKLGCWCVDWGGTGPPPLACHAVALALLAEGIDPATVREPGLFDAEVPG